MSKMTTAARLLALLPIFGAAAAGAASGIQEVLTPAQFFECQIAARQATIQGLQERASQVNQAGVTDAQKRAAGEMARQRVTLAMYACGKQNASTLGAYAHRNADELQTWLNANPQVKVRLDALSQSVTSLSSQMPAVSPSAKR